MATGEGRRNGASLSAVELSYPGKKSVDEVLAMEPHTYLMRTVAGEVEVTNRLYFADNLGVLATLRNDKSIREKIKLIYIDPPYATQVSFAGRNQKHAYKDLETGPAYLEAIRQRIILMHDLLAEDGSIYVHIDERMTAYLRIILDEVFGPQNFRNEIVRQKCNPKNSTSRTLGNVTDRILFYSKTAKYIWNRPFVEWDEARAMKEYSYIEDETGRRYKKVPIHAPGTRNGATGTEWRGLLPPPGKHWQYPPATLDAMDARGEIYWSPNGNPRRKIYFDESRGIALQDLWLDVKDAHNQNILITGYPTEKNPEILSRIISASSNKGDIVLDAYAGSGTTLDVSSSLGRNWIGMDDSPEAIRTISQRLKYQMEKMGDFVSQDNQELPTDTLFDLAEYQATIMRQGGPVSFQLFFDAASSGMITELMDQR